ncbi:NAD(P)-dependent oxidoreductase [Streptomyces decoyicus]|uniref:NAD(P)-dependent oxidoreductase n=1 Tax=Streptomyces decoyicus TaxID=249567 RepID=UPI00386E0F3E
MTPRCAVLDDYQDVALSMADWSALAGAVDVRTLRQPFRSEDEVVAAIGDCEIVVAMRERTPFPASLLARLPRLRLLITSGMRNAAIDLEAAARHGVTVCGTASNTEPPVELTWALILGLARSVVTESAAMRGGGPWQSTLGADLHGRTLGLLGLGKIGSRVARIGQAFGMNVTAWSQNLTSRAAIVDQPALLRALREDWIAGAGLDVFDHEPLPAGHPLRTLPNVLALPHLGYVTRRNYEGYFPQAVEDIAAFLAGSPIRQLG